MSHIIKDWRLNLLFTLALEFLRKELDNPDSTLNGHQRMARYLTEIAKDELELVFQCVRYVIKASPEDALLVCKRVAYC